MNVTRLGQRLGCKKMSGFMCAAFLRRTAVSGSGSVSAEGDGMSMLVSDDPCTFKNAVMRSTGSPPETVVLIVTLRNAGRERAVAVVRLREYVEIMRSLTIGSVGLGKDSTDSLETLLPTKLRRSRMRNDWNDAKNKGVVSGMWSTKPVSFQYKPWRDGPYNLEIA